jgi:general secretion pathway protein G
MELLIVIVVIAVLASIALPKFINAGMRSKEAALKSDIKITRSAVQLFLNDTGAYPTTLFDLCATTAPSTGLDYAGGSKGIIAMDWKGPYMDQPMVDPVSGNAFTYLTTSPNVGKVRSSATGNATDGTAYSTW